MEDKSFLLSYGDDDVVSFPESSCTHKFGKFRNAINSLFTDKSKIVAQANSELINQLGIGATNWFQTGVSCEVLKLGDKSWQKGKVKIKISLEFCPDEPVQQPTASNQPESPLDDIRRTLN